MVSSYCQGSYEISLNRKISSWFTDLNHCWIIILLRCCPSVLTPSRFILKCWMFNRYSFKLVSIGFRLIALYPVFLLHTQDMFYQSRWFIESIWLGGPYLKEKSNIETRYYAQIHKLCVCFGVMSVIIIYRYDYDYVGRIFKCLIWQSWYLLRVYVFAFHWKPTWRLSERCTYYSLTILSAKLTTCISFSRKWKQLRTLRVF